MKLDKLVNAHADINDRTAQEANSIGYMSRVLVQGCWPHEEKLETTLTRQDGKFKITLWNEDGLPYGSYPRLIMAWVVTEAVLTGSPELHLGRSLREFMDKLDISCTGGKKGTIIRLKEQVERVFTTNIKITLIEEDEAREIGHKVVSNFNISEHFELWWSLKHNTADSLWESKLTLSDKFFTEITEHGYPFDLRVIRAFKKSPLALDLYFLLSHRIFNVNRKGKPARIPWTALQKQVGAGFMETPEGRRNFKKRSKTYLTKIILLWPGLHLQEYEKGIVLNPSKLPVSAAKKD
jgi:hypothetical protein